jgi:hypothetical protein
MRFNGVWIAFGLALVVLAASGCGSKKSTATTGAATTTTASAATTSTADMGGTTTVNSGGSTPSFASAKNCVQLASVGQKFAQAMAAASGSGKSSLSTAADAYKELANAAPSAIRSDFETIAAAFQGYAKALEKSGYTPGKTPTASQAVALQAAVKTFSSAKLQAASQHLSAWAKQNCSR